jgi:hypothetical protein
MMRFFKAGELTAAEWEELPAGIKANAQILTAGRFQSLKIFI